MHLEEHPQIARQRLRDPAFAEAVLITPFNESVFYFAQQRAINFAKTSGAPSFWIQAADCPPAWFRSGYSTEDLLQLKKKWLEYHARETDGILSLLLLACYNMPYKVTCSHGQDFKKYGVHNGSRCRLKAWDLGEADVELCRSQHEEAMILKEMPKTLFVEMAQPLKEPYPGLPDKWFPMKVVTCYWTLDAQDSDIFLKSSSQPRKPVKCYFA